MRSLAAIFLALLVSPALADVTLSPNPLATPTVDAKAANDPVEIIKKQYYDMFAELPESRKCAPADAKGAWKEYAILQSASSDEAAAQRADGPKYMTFGEYNRLLWKRSASAMDLAAINAALPATDMQYIITTAGMFFAYRNGSLDASRLCFVSTKKTDKYNTGMLMLALPIEKDKPLVISIYTPVEK